MRGDLSCGDGRTRPSWRVGAEGWLLVSCCGSSEAFHETILSGCCSRYILNNRALHCATDACSERFYAGSSQVRAYATLSAARGAASRFGRQPNGFIGRLHDSSQDARWLQGRPPHSSQPGECNCCLRTLESWNWRPSVRQQNDEPRS